MSRIFTRFYPLEYSDPAKAPRGMLVRCGSDLYLDGRKIGANGSEQNVLELFYVTDLYEFVPQNDNVFVYTSSYSPNIAEGGGFFVWISNSNSSDDRGISVIKPNQVSGSGRWHRVRSPDDKPIPQWGGLSQESLQSYFGVDSRVVLAAIINTYQELYLPVGTWLIDSAIDVNTSRFVLEGHSRAILKLSNKTWTNSEYVGRYGYLPTSGENFDFAIRGVRWIESAKISGFTIDTNGSGRNYKPSTQYETPTGRIAPCAIWISGYDIKIEDMVFRGIAAAEGTGSVNPVREVFLINIMNPWMFNNPAGSPPIDTTSNVYFKGPEIRRVVFEGPAPNLQWGPYGETPEITLININGSQRVRRFYTNVIIEDLTFIDCIRSSQMKRVWHGITLVSVKGAVIRNVRGRLNGQWMFSWAGVLDSVSVEDVDVQEGNSGFALWGSATYPDVLANVANDRSSYVIEDGVVKHRLWECGGLNPRYSMIINVASIETGESLYHYDVVQNSDGTITRTNYQQITSTGWTYVRGGLEVRNSNTSGWSSQIYKTSGGDPATTFKNITFNRCNFYGTGPAADWTAFHGFDIACFWPSSANALPSSQINPYDPSRRWMNNITLRDCYFEGNGYSVAIRIYSGFGWSSKHWDSIIKGLRFQNCYAYRRVAEGVPEPYWRTIMANLPSFDAIEDFELDISYPQTPFLGAKKEFKGYIVPFFAIVTGDWYQWHYNLDCYRIPVAVMKVDATTSVKERWLFMPPTQRQWTFGWIYWEGALPHVWYISSELPNNDPLKIYLPCVAKGGIWYPYWRGRVGSSPETSEGIVGHGFVATIVNLGPCQILIYQCQPTVIGGTTYYYRNKDSATLEAILDAGMSYVFWATP